MLGGVGAAQTCIDPDVLGETWVSHTKGSVHSGMFACANARLLHHIAPCGPPEAGDDRMLSPDARRTTNPQQ